VSDLAISARGLRKDYGELEAVRGIDLEVPRGEVFAFLGPNGAGKTTTVEILEGYRERSGGEVEVLGADPARGSREWRERLGIVPQDCNVPPYLTVREALTLYAGYYAAPRPVADVIDLVGLGGKADERGARLSGGQQRRLDVGLALIGDPDLLFLDEPTTGFDPTARRQAWEVLAGLRELGVTIFLTTHYMEEAQRLADRVAIIRRGEIVGLGRPDEIGDRTEQPAVITFRVADEAAAKALEGQLRDRDNGRSSTAAAGLNGTFRLEANDPTRLLHELTGWAVNHDVVLENLEVRRPSLEDVYLRLTDQAEVDPAEAPR
jgi:ABC-2 type transport system ATP-binding protein